MRFFLIISILGYLSTAKSSSSFYVSSEESIDHILNYLVKNQVKETRGQDQFEGEWPSYMINKNNPPFKLLGGKGYKAPDSNCFTVNKIAHILANAYLEYNLKDERILKMFSKSLKASKGCFSSETSTFNFWHLVKTPDQLIEKLEKRKRRKKNLNDDIFLRRNPNHYDLQHLYLHNFANIFDDADDTSLGLQVILDAKKMGLESELESQGLKAPNTIGQIFNKVDQDRVGSNLFDVFNRRPTETGAFLTWFGEEKESKKKPFSRFVPNTTEANMPMGVNDVDCVVNANVLSVLSSYGEFNKTKGAKKSCEYLKKVVVHKRLSKSCAIYYPNIFNVYYSVANSYENGVNCLAPVKNELVETILSRQNKDGSFKAFKDGRDIIHSTLFASIALLNFDLNKNSNNINKIKSALLRSNEFLISQLDNSKNLKEGIFFSAGAFVRNSLYWKSQSYTMALYLEYLLKLSRFLN